MADLAKAKKKIALLHRFPEDRIKETNAAFPFLSWGMEVLTFKSFNRLSNWNKFLKSVAWIFYAPLLVFGKNYHVIYCDDSFPFYPALVKLASPRSRVVIRLGDLHLMYYTQGLTYKILHFFEKIAWKMADDIIAISKVMAEYVSEETGKKVHVALDPVNEQDFKVGSCANIGTVMFHGLLTRNKNIDLLLKCAERMPDRVFVIVGDGPDRKRLESMAPDNVIFKGWVPFKDIKHFIKCCAVGVALRSDNPGNEYVVTSPFLQYGIMGKPCLVTRRKVFEDYPWQFSGTNEMFYKLKELLKAPDQEGQKLKERILRDHSAQKIAEDIWGILTLQS